MIQPKKKKPVKDRMNLPYNINSTIKFAALLISTHKGVTHASNTVIEIVKEYCKERRFVDTHIKIFDNLKIPYELNGYLGEAEKRLAKAIHVNFAILCDILDHFKCPFMQNIDIDIDTAVRYTIANTMKRMNCNYGVNYGSLPKYDKLDKKSISSLLYVSEYVGMPILQYISDDEDENLIQFFPFNTYGGKKLSEYKNVYNKAFCKLIVPDEIHNEIMASWNYDKKSTKTAIREIMEPYFYKEEISAFIKTMPMAAKRSECTGNEVKLDMFNDYIVSYYRDFSFKTIQ